MRGILILMTLFMLLSSALVFADDEKSAKEGFKDIHRGMKKVTRAVDKNAKKGFKTVHKHAKKDVRKIDKTAKEGWKEVGRDIKNAGKE